MKNKLDFSEFNPSSHEDWKKRVSQELGKEPYESLLWNCENQFEMEPYYSDSKWQSVHVPSNNWELMHEIDIDLIEDDIDLINKLIIESLEGGCNSLLLTNFEIDPEDFSDVLAGVNAEWIKLHFYPRYRYENMQPTLYTWAKANKLNTAAMQGSILNPYERIFFEEGPTKKEVWQETILFKEVFPLFRFSTLYEIAHDGGPAAHEIAVQLYKALLSFEFLLEKGLDSSAVKDWFQFSVTTQHSYFIDIAKMRVLRKLWLALQAQYLPKGEQPCCYIKADVSSYMLTTYDAYNNMVRNTTQAMSAILGGADVVNVPCFDRMLANGSSNSFRYSRNTLNVLLHESAISEARNAAQGSHYIQHLEEKLSQQVWILLKQMLKGKSNPIDALTDVYSSADDFIEIYDQKLKDGDTVRVGINKYINPTEKDSLVDFCSYSTFTCDMEDERRKNEN